MSFMSEGGVFMWVMVVVTLASVVLSAVLGKKSDKRFCLLGALACVAFGMLGCGLGLGLTASAAQAAEASAQLAYLAEGTDESANNLVLGGALGVLLVIASLALDHRK